MSKPRRVVRAITASLTLIFVGSPAGRTSSGARAAPDTTLATITTVMRDYNTAASQRLKSEEADFNQKTPSGVSPVVYLVYDKVATWFAFPEGPSTVEKA